MIAYVDSTVLLRVVLRQRDALKEWRRLTQGVASALVEVECLRTARAAQPLPTALGTLDAIHLATALLCKEQAEMDLSMATHDAALASASKARGLRVIGV